jgi:serine O-acetyltransferase
MTEAIDDPIEAPPGEYWDIERITSELRDARDEWRNAHRRHAEHGAVGFPSRHVIEKIMAALCGALFPLRLGPSFVRMHNEEAFVAETLQTALSRLYGQIRLELAYAAGIDAPQLIDVDAGRIIGA